MSLDCWSDSDQNAIRAQLDRIVQSGPFAHSPRRQRFLEYIVNETLAGRGGRLKGYNVGLEVFDRPETFDPAIDPIVRIEAGRVREKLREYYDTDGLNDPVRIDLPKGAYTPQIEFRGTDTPKPDARSTFRRKMTASPLAAIATVGVLLLAGFAVWNWLGPSAPLSEKASIAVLPFENIGNEPQWARFADGLTGDIVDLSRSKDLFVVARNSTEAYKANPPT